MILPSIKFLRLVCPLVALTVVGCGGSAGENGRAIVSGLLLENGKPFTADKIPLPKGATAPPPGSKDVAVRIVFVPVGGTEQFPAIYHADTGKFEVRGTEGSGINAGEYKVAIVAGYNPDPRGGGDYFQGKFSVEKTQIVREVKPGVEITIDVASPKG